MAKKGEKIPAKTGIRLYNLLLKELTDYNNQLPIDKRYSIAHRRKLVSTLIYPQFKDKAYKEKSLKNIRNAIGNIAQNIEPVEICNLNYLSPAVYQFVEWFDLDNFFKNVLPSCVYAKVTAGYFGDTEIFNTEDYNYYDLGIRDIVEACREYCNNTSGYVYFTGYVKVQEGRTNDGLPDSYYLDLIAHIDDAPQGEAVPERYEAPAGKKREAQKAKTKVKKVIDDRLKEFKKIKSKQAKKRKKPPTPKKKIEKPKKVIPKKPVKKEASKQNDKQRFDSATAYLKQLTTMYNEGLITKKILQDMVKQIDLS